jgi:hypothetical protein
MEQHSMTSTSVLDPTPVVPARAKEESLPACAHVSPKGRHCHQAVFSADSPYCSIHARQRRHSTSQITSQLASKLKEVQSASDITEFLIGVLNLLAEDRIPARRAAVLTYIANSIRQSLRDEQREADSSTSVRLDFSDLLSPDPPPVPEPPAPSGSAGILPSQT